MAGARGFQDNTEWIIPTTDDADFAKIMVNTVKAPTKNRHFLADATDAVKAFAVSGSDVDLGTTDVLTIDTEGADYALLWALPLDSQPAP
jgi:hypothetical protein